MSDVHPMTVVGIRLDVPSNQPIVLLKESDGERYLPIWIGAPEATAIAWGQQGMQTSRPLTHDLLRDVVAALSNGLERVVIDDLRDSVFYATLVFAGGIEVSSRPSDAIALAVRTGAPVFTSESVLEQGSITLSDAEGDESDGDAGAGEGSAEGVGAGSDAGADNELEKFREFLDTISPEDFDLPS